jgi:hypothetical protein
MPTKTLVNKVAAKKVSSRKVAAKKAPAKKTSAKAEARKTLVYADNANSFWVTDGQVLNSLVALEYALGVMSVDTFAHHVNKEKNDFFAWVDVVLNDRECAALLQKAKTKTSARTVVKNRLTHYVV